MKYARGGMTSLDYLMEIQRLENELKKYDWISVKDKLPEPNTVVLAHYDDGIICTVAFLDKHLKFMSSDTVTHWMPLPQKPESEDDAEWTSRKQ